MMENNNKKYFNNSLSCIDEEQSTYTKDADQIILGKRGRPSKKIQNEPGNIAETLLGNYLSKIDENVKVQKLVVKRNSYESCEKDNIKKIKDKKKIKPVYFDDILMETLTITGKVNNKKNIFHVRRKDLLYVMNDKILTRFNPLPFVPVSDMLIKIERDLKDDE